jgi:hypothetical protein
VTKLSRRVLHHAADSSRLGTLVLRTPRLARAARRAADRYLGGETLEQAVATIDRLHTEGFTTAIDSFGEAVTDRERIEETVARYLRVNSELAHLKPPVNVWVDLSNLGLDISSDLCLRSVDRIVETLPGERGSRFAPTTAAEPTASSTSRSLLRSTAPRSCQLCRHTSAEAPRTPTG